MEFSDLCELTLRKGVNYLIYKIDQGDGGWGLYRKFITKDYLRSLYQKNVYKLYSDLPNECIINDTASYLRLKYDNRFKYDTFHEINFIWDNTNYAKKRAQNFITLNANQIPSRLQTPRLNRFSPHELDIQVNDIENNDLVFRERIPIFAFMRKQMRGSSSISWRSPVFETSAMLADCARRVPFS